MAELERAQEALERGNIAARAKHNNSGGTVMAVRAVAAANVTALVGCWEKSEAGELGFQELVEFRFRAR